MNIQTFARFSSGIAINVTRRLRLNIGRRGVSATIRDDQGRSVYNTRTRKATARILGFTVSRKIGGKR